MKLIAISDTHYKLNLEIPPCDFLVHAGDFSFRGKPEEVKGFLEWYSSFTQARHKILIAGNHDLMCEDSPEMFQTFLETYAPNVTYLNDSGCEIQGKKFYGSPVTPYFHDWAFNRHRGAEIKVHWDKIPEGLDVLITHGPPYGILDIVERVQDHVGCQDLLEAVERTKPKVHIFGHIHCAYGIKDSVNTKFINAAVLGEDYKLHNRPVEIEI